MKAGSNLDAGQYCPRLLLNILWKSARPYRASPAWTTAEVNPSVPAREAAASTEHGKARVPVCAPGKTECVQRARPQGRWQNFNGRLVRLPSLCLDMTIRKASLLVALLQGATRTGSNPRCRKEQGGWGAGPDAGPQQIVWCGATVRKSYCGGEQL
jgi:hypothetical protein